MIFQDVIWIFLNFCGRNPVQVEVFVNSGQCGVSCHEHHSQGPCKLLASLEGIKKFV
jgi:hypothetical protein